MLAVAPRAGPEALANQTKCHCVVAAGRPEQTTASYDPGAMDAEAKADWGVTRDVIQAPGQYMAV